METFSWSCVCVSDCHVCASKRVRYCETNKLLQVCSKPVSWYIYSCEALPIHYQLAARTSELTQPYPLHDSWNTRIDSRNSLQSAGASGLATMLNSPSCGLEELDLSWNCCSGRGTVDLGRSLKNQVLRYTSGLQSKDRQGIHIQAKRSLRFRPKWYGRRPPLR